MWKMDWREASMEAWRQKGNYIRLARADDGWDKGSDRVNRKNREDEKYV